MAHILHFRPTQRVIPTAPRLCCERCGTDLWTLTADGAVRCADCELVHPFSFQPVLEQPSPTETSTRP